MQTALTASHRQLSSLCEAVQQHMSEHQSLAQQAARTLLGPLEAQPSMPPPDVLQQKQVVRLMERLAAREQEVQDLQQQLEQLRDAFTDLVGIHALLHAGTQCNWLTARVP